MTPKKFSNVQISSEVVLADVEEFEFETPVDLAGFSVSAEKIQTVVEQKPAPSLVVTTATTPKVHKLEKVDVKVGWIKIGRNILCHCMTGICAHFYSIQKTVRVFKFFKIF